MCNQVEQRPSCLAIDTLGWASNELYRKITHKIFNSIK